MTSLNPLDCIICYEEFNSTQRRPCIGKCGHSLCEQCKISLKSAKCPQCNRDYSFLTTTINYQLLELVRDKNSPISSSRGDEKEGRCSNCGVFRENLRICIKCGLEKNILVNDDKNKIYINWKGFSSIDEAVERLHSFAICEHCALEEHEFHGTMKFSKFEKDLKRFAPLEQRITEVQKLPETLLRDFGSAFKEAHKSLDYLNFLSKSIAPYDMNRHYKNISKDLNDLYTVHDTLLEGFQKLVKTIHNMKNETENIEFTGRVIDKNVMSLANSEPLLTIDHKPSSNAPFRIGIFNPKVRQWANFGVTSIPKSNYAVASSGTSIYLVGGEADGMFLGDVEILDGLARIRRRAKNMRKPRSHAAATFHNGKLFVCGGFDGEHTNKVEIYDPETKMWQDGPDMTFERADCGLVSFAGGLYVLGGVNSTEYVSKIEKLNEAENKFEIYGDMCGTRAGFGACVFEGRIYIAGGWGLEKRERGHCRSFEPISRIWREEALMNRDRMYFDFHATEEAMYAIRGWTQNGDLIEEIERYDKTTKTWATISCKVNQ